jgi:ketosteroid isomerase-like protein
MSQENVEIVRRLYDALNTLDVPSGEELTHADLEWIPDSRVGVGPIRGRENMIRFFMDQADMFEEIHMDIERLWEIDDKVLAFVHGTGRVVAAAHRSRFA